jgi:anti-sigma factor ChrR (cupin superfamily)
MLLYNLHNFMGGWIVGDFDPSLLKTTDMEVSIKRYKAGDKDAAHYHKEAEEITVIVTGEVTINGTHFKQDDVIRIEKGEVAEFAAVTDAITCVVKRPSVKGDKYFV